MELHDRRQVEEVYTIRQVAELTGVPENTIRSWERRFGIPQPARSGGNQRRYTERDIDIIRSIQASRDRGRTMEQAIHDVAQAEGTTLAPDQTVVEPAAFDLESPSIVAPSPDLTVERLAHALAAFQGGEADSLLADRLWGSSVEIVCVDLLLPGMRTIERHLAAGSISSVQARFGKEWIRRKLISAFDQSNPELGETSVVVTSMHDATAVHDGLCLSILFSRAGHRVSWLGGHSAVTDVALAIDHLSPSAVLLAARSELSIIALRAATAGLEVQRRAGAWNGMIAASSDDPAQGNDVVNVPIHATGAISTFEAALRARRAGLRLVKRQ